MRGKIIVHYAKADRLEAGDFNPVCGKSSVTLKNRHLFSGSILPS
jgi:hypothetical protein